jgi:hypothetical protein
MTCVSTAQQATEPVDTEQPLSSLIGTLCIHPNTQRGFMLESIQSTRDIFLILVGPRQAR